MPAAHAVLSQLQQAAAVNADSFWLTDMCAGTFQGLSMDQIAVSFGDHWFWGKFKGVRQYKEERYDAAKNTPAGAKQQTIAAH